MKILICGLPGSGKSTLAQPLAELLNAVWLNADSVRGKYEGAPFIENGWDFSKAGRVAQATRMKYLADGIVLANKIVVADFICPTQETRELFDADFTVFMDTIKEGRYADTNAMFEKPTNCDYHVSDWFINAQDQLLPVVQRYMNLKIKGDLE
jgi:adenylylsulfate kinase